MLDKFLKLIDKDPSKVNINLIDETRDKLGHAINIFDATNLDLNFEYIERTEDLYMGLSKIVNIVKDIERSKKQGQGLKIITPKQMLSRLLILLAQILTGNNSAKLKNEIRQLLYSLYRSKKISKRVYNNLITTM